MTSEQSSSSITLKNSNVIPRPGLKLSGVTDRGIHNLVSYTNKLICNVLLVLLFTCPTSYALEIHGHRGTRGTHPENSLAGFKEAIRIGADAIEFDLQVSADDVLVIHHDPIVDMDICTAPKDLKLPNPAFIRQIKLADLQKIDCGSKADPNFPEQRLSPEKIPTFEDLLKLVTSSNSIYAQKLMLDVELKTTPAFPEQALPPKQFAKQAIKLLKKYGLLERANILAFNYDVITSARTFEPSLITTQLIETNLVNLSAVAKTSKANRVSPPWQWLTKKEVDRLHKHGYKVVPWNANDKQAWQYCIDIGVDGIVTDYPAKLIAYTKTIQQQKSV